MVAHPFSEIERVRSQWYKRLLAEWKYCTGTVFFITLTYDDKHVPVEFTEDDMLVGLKASKRDVQLFMKLVRRHHTEQLGKVRYFCVSEYGSLTNRPHYHMILFTEKKCTKDYMLLEVLHKRWRNGYILDAQYLRGPAGLRYVCKYIGKSFGDTRTFRLMSRMPGLGFIYVERHKNYHRGQIETPCIGCRSRRIFKNPQSQQKPILECITTCHRLRKAVDQLRERDFYVLGVTQQKGEKQKRPTLPRYFRENIYHFAERQLITNLKIDEDEREYYSHGITQRIRQQAQRMAEVEVREMVCKRRSIDFYRRSRPVLGNFPEQLCHGNVRQQVQCGFDEVGDHESA